MPPKAKPAATKGAATLAKPAAAAAAAAAAANTVMPPPAAKTKPLILYSINVCDAAVVTYYNNNAVDCVEVKIHFNGVVPAGSCKFTITADGMSILWQCATNNLFCKQTPQGHHEGQLLH
jgi:hypothetical protein